MRTATLCKCAVAAASLALAACEGVADWSGDKSTVGPAAQIAAVAGGASTVELSSAMGEPLVATVKDASGKPIAGFAVAFAVASGDATLSAQNVTTDAS